MPGLPFTPLIVGCGDVGRRLARALITAGLRPVGLVRSQGAADALGRQGIAPVVTDLDRQVDEPPAAAADGTVFYLVPPGAEADDDDPRLRRFLAACEEAVPRRLVYLGTSGVYGDCGGAWVDESRPPAPLTARAQRRLAAEGIARAWCEAHGTELVVLRVGGIYGPGRLPLDRLDRMTVVCPDEAPWSNRIHVDDLVAVLHAAALRAPAGRIYNVADGDPTTMTDFLYAVADIAGMPRPPCVPLADAPAHLSPGMLSFVQESRRLDVTRLRRELGVTPRFATLAEGLADCRAREGTRRARPAVS
ncbi:MAG: SDR family oxidoreductase [Halofilum sp. (in: g-proteobacteria)]|nr:SDR family oxidoreductase [Halofilum sp. (in: g-proteobacteria)]